jgi:BirA family biotin operon repressor/biotin-[acetyl-CoA-carboxylase] ligase
MSASSPFHALEARAIQRALTTAALGRTVHVLDTAASTNALASRMAQEGAPHGTVVVAESQSAGRGRLGRHWYSPPGKNLYCSVLLRTALPGGRLAHWLSWTPLIAALAAARAIQTTAGLSPSVKWPNDILLGDRKAGGVLCESGDLGSGTPYVVAGIGLNVNIQADEFPEELRAIATSLAAEAQRPFDRAVLLAALLSDLETRYDTFLAGHETDIHREYVTRCATVGRQVRVERAGADPVTGRAMAVGTDGALKIVLADGSHLDIHAGDVIHLR